MDDRELSQFIDIFPLPKSLELFVDKFFRLNKRAIQPKPLQLQLSTPFMSAFLGGVQHPINILQEYLAAFSNKCQAAILSWLDNWTKTKRKEGESDWVWLVLQDLAAELGYCKDTIFRHLRSLLELGVIERQRAKRWATD